MKDYQRKPVIVQAVKYEGHNWREIGLWVNEYGYNAYRDDSSDSLIIPTLEGKIRYLIGNYIVKGANDEFYPCASLVFDKTYDEVTVMPKGSDNYDPEKHPYEDMYKYNGSEKGITL